VQGAPGGQPAAEGRAEPKGRRQAEHPGRSDAPRGGGNTERGGGNAERGGGDKGGPRSDR
jgi:hypothetical protein